MTETFTLKSGLVLPAFGLGTWKLGEDGGSHDREVAAVLHAVERGFIHIDTAEMYGEGATERLLADAIAQTSREGLIVTSKVYPWNAGRRDIVTACECSLDRLGIDWIDLYLLHWPGNVPFAETLEGALHLRAQGKIRAFGISNFDAHALEHLIAAGLAEEVEVNQVMYNPSRRGIEYDLLPLMDEAGLVCMAYTPIEPARLARSRPFTELAAEQGLTSVQLAFAWALTAGRAIPIPKASTIAHVDELAAVLDRPLDRATMERIDAIFPPPGSPQPLDIL